jgi:hypothetical protein
LHVGKSGTGMCERRWLSGLITINVFHSYVWK